MAGFKNKTSDMNELLGLTLELSTWRIIANLTGIVIGVLLVRLIF